MKTRDISRTRSSGEEDEEKGRGGEGCGGAPPVLSHSSRQIFISAASATSEIRIRSLTHDARVSYMLPGSTVVSEPETIKISREEWVGKWLCGHHGIRKMIQPSA